MDPTFSLVIKSITVEAVSAGETVGGADLMFVSTDRPRTSFENAPVSSICLECTLCWLGYLSCLQAKVEQLQR
jgi:hypothetical protein